jgi:hypothetical protein
MAVKIISYNGYELRALALQVQARDRFMSSLLIVRDPAMDQSDFKLFPPQSSEEDGLFSSESDAIEAAITLGRQVVDGQAWGFSVEDL